jgi:hypothetical protein
MDPVALGPAQWSDLSKLLISLWCVAGFVVLFAANMLVGHIFIPSLVGSFHLPSIAQRARPVFYAIGLISIAGAAYELVLVIDLADVLETFWSDYWI